jgi:hypothetical protein
MCGSTVKNGKQQFLSFLVFSVLNTPVQAISRNMKLFFFAEKTLAQEGTIS